MKSRISKKKMLKNLPIPGPFNGTKILAHPDHLVPWSKKEQASPIGLEIDPTNKCNLNCWFCTNAKFRNSNSKSLSVQTVQDVISDFSELGGHSVVFTGGGEPTLHPDLSIMIQYSHDKNVDVALITNGTIWRKDVASLILNYGKWVRISLDASNDKMYKETHGNVDAYDTVISNIHRWVQLKKTLGSNCTIGVGYLTTEKTIDGIVDVTKLMKKIGPDYLQFRPVIFQQFDNRFNNDSVIKGASEKLINFLTEVSQYSTDSFRVLSSLPKYEMIIYGQKNTTKYCSGVDFASVLSADGNIYICCHMRGLQQYSLGSVYEKSFKEIWLDKENRNSIYKSIDFKNDCEAACRFYAQNKLLGTPNEEKIKRMLDLYGKLNKKEEHVNYL